MMLAIDRPRFLVFDRSWADAYVRGGWEATEVRPGAWEVVNPKMVARELSEQHKKGAKGK